MNADGLDMSDWISRVALEMVGQTVLGYSFDPLDGPHNNPYTSKYAIHHSPTLFALSVVRQFAPFLSSLGPAWFRRKMVEWTPNTAVQKVKDMSDVMHKTAQEILQQKREEITTQVEKATNKYVISVLRMCLFIDLLHEMQLWPNDVRACTYLKNLPPL